MSSPDVRGPIVELRYGDDRVIPNYFWSDIVLPPPDIGADPEQIGDWATLIFEASEYNFGDNE